MLTRSPLTVQSCKRTTCMASSSVYNSPTCPPPTKYVFTVQRKCCFTTNKKRSSLQRCEHIADFALNERTEKNPRFHSYLRQQGIQYKPFSTQHAQIPPLHFLTAPASAWRRNGSVPAWAYENPRERQRNPDSSLILVQLHVLINTRSLITLKFTHCHKWKVLDPSYNFSLVV